MRLIHTCTTIHRTRSTLLRLLPLSLKRGIEIMATGQQQPPWSTPQRQTDEPVLKIYNSFTRTKTEFVPRNGRLVKWYNCGPTVYDASHMGHARNYVTQDILRRILSDYFGYDVHFVMNITDIDDKIIVRARQNHVLENFILETNSLSPELISEIDSAWVSYVQKNVLKGLLPEDRPTPGAEHASWPQIVTLTQDIEWKRACSKRDEKFDMHFSAANKTIIALGLAKEQIQSGRTGREAALELIDKSRDILSGALDERFGAAVTDHSIFRSLSTYWEKQFFNDMQRLRVRNPDTLTRVTEYVPDIVAFVEGIIKNGYGYEVDGSVYFNTTAFDGHNGHYYAKLEPWSKGNRELLEEGEGALSARSGRRTASDFALWKASKPGEPSWPSPWGSGRPGWHIECSVMASAILGDNMDIHSGGIDLAFPHHDNEIAQSEAYHNCESWVNYFIHTGHLHIEGLKMSKSLKNFITIDEILQKYTARQLRIAFLTQLWSSKVDFSESLMTGEVRTIETTINNFFTTVKALVNQARARAPRAEARHNYGDEERSLVNSLYESQAAFRAALCDSFNTPVALNVIRDLVSRTNIHINSRGGDVDVNVIEQVAAWITKMLRIFGLGERESIEIGWGQEGEQGDNSVNREETLMPYLQTLSSFRDGVRQLAMAKGDRALKDILALCDKLRDHDLIPLGVALDDQQDGKALVKLVPPSDLIRAREEKRKQAEAKAAQKAAAVDAERQKRLQKLEKGRTPPQDMFKPPHVPDGTYSSWNEDGIPFTDGEGKELSKNQVKKVQSAWAGQKKLHEEFLAWSREQYKQ